jgi:hypothetical protein
MDAADKACASSRPSGGNGGNSSAIQAYVSCLADHGVAVSTTTSTTAKAGTTNSTGAAGRRPPSFDRNDPAFAAADQACAPLRPAPAPTATSTTAVSQ